jgi:hypothetical protein
MMSEESLTRKDEPKDFLLVEGPNDEHMFYSLLQYHRVPQRFKIEKKGGINPLLDTLDVELDRSGLNRLGIVVDANADLATRWQSLRNKLTELGYSSVPGNPLAGGTIIEQDGRPIVGIWLMPDNTNPGMLEDFVRLLLRQGDVLWPIAEDTLQKVIAVECRFRESYKSKATLYTWLAWQEEPGKPIGQAITANYLDANAILAQQLIRWIRKLFDLEIVYP